MSNPEKKLYSRQNSIVFKKTKEPYGAMSNMAPGFPISINGVKILTSEALYQACRFPHLPNVQKEIISQNSPMTAKMISKPYRNQSRSDWNESRIKIMRWCLRVKLYQNWLTFSEELKQTRELPIVEESHKDSFWGAIPDDDSNLFGTNALGRLLMELREEAKQIDNEVVHINTPKIDDFLLYGKPISTIQCRLSLKKSEKDHSKKPNVNEVTQTLLFEE
ncbi:NADAR family protein [Paenibacillus sp. Lou8.1]|uniref:NADAR family protein n=1 Tax=Paenibacillus sp. MZ03-122A TaxID=2962033 RepID=UPI0020B7E8B1|nr:NADAR family protein [Paenibacillus sp. MZ03-122A]MCP3808593.1 NADAR family protein [Paenibacillus sp. Lou8.1]